MTNSGLIVFLPLIGAILGGIVGAVGGAWANSWYRNREAKKAEGRELQGLMTLIFAEYGHNAAVLRMLIGEPSLMDIRSLTNPQTAVWDDIKVRLAQLLPREHVVALVLYYWQIQNILDHINDEEMLPEIKLGVVQGGAEQAQ